MSRSTPSMPTKLNLGCGLKPLPGFINVDVIAAVKPDVVHDLNQFPYPFADSSFTEICAFDVVEHIQDLPAVFRELWRIGRPGARLQLTTPHFSCSNSYIDPTHCHHLSYYSWITSLRGIRSTSTEATGSGFRRGGSCSPRASAIK